MNVRTGVRNGALRTVWDGLRFGKVASPRFCIEPHSELMGLGLF